MNFDTNNNNYTNSNSCDCNYVKESVIKIDRLQKEIMSNTIGTCVSCDTTLLTYANNTIPVRFTSCCGNVVEAIIGADGATTSFFRIESIRCQRFVTLRLLELEGTELVGTNYTMILDLDCVGSVQCFEPTNVEVCTASTPAVGVGA